MKIGSAVLGVAVLCAFSLTQGCLTTATDNGGNGARHKGPFQHEYKGSSSSEVAAVQPMPDYGTDMGGESIYSPGIVDIAPLEPMPSSASTSSTESYIVRKGDTLSQLAVDFDTTTAELVRLNSLSNPDVLYVGQELRVPAGRGGVTSSSSRKSTDSVKKGGTYTIQKGDTLSEIAIAAGVSIDSLRQLNHIQGDKIMAGETLDIPAGGKVPTTAQKAPAKKSTPKTAPKVETKAPAATELALPEMAPATAEEAASEGSGESSFNIVEERVLYPGETLDDIAREYGVSKAEILRVNTQFTDESQVQAGTRLRIPIAE